MTAQRLLDQLQQESQIIVQQVQEKLLSLDERTLRQRPAPQQWNALECLEHLSLTYDYYLPQMEEAIHEAPTDTSEETYESTWLGRMSISSMKPKKDGKIPFKMKTFERIKPTTDHRSPQEVINRFINHQQTFEYLTQQAQNVSVNNTKVTTLAGPLVRLRLGDCFRFLLAHTQRHLLQAQQAVASAHG
jgi:hypothetical protein